MFMKPVSYYAVFLYFAIKRCGHHISKATLSIKNIKAVNIKIEDDCNILMIVNQYLHGKSTVVKKQIKIQVQ